jgi:hypothetical protein
MEGKPEANNKPPSEAEMAPKDDGDNKSAAIEIVLKKPINSIAVSSSFLIK